NTLHLNGAAFYYDYKGYQAYSSFGFLTQFITNNKARVEGFELEASGSPIEGLTYNIFGTYLDATVFDIELPSGDATADRQMPQAPRWSFGSSLRYAFPAFGGHVALGTNWKWNSAQYFSAFNAPIDRQGSYAAGDVRLEYKPDRAPVEFA